MPLPLKPLACAAKLALMSRVTPALDTTDHNCPSGSATVETLLDAPAGLCHMPCSAEVAAFVGGIGFVGSGFVGSGFVGSGVGVGVVGSGDGVGRLGSDPPPPPLPQPTKVKASRVAAVSANAVCERRELVFKDFFMFFIGKNV